jgi:hypothetical protein
MEETLNSCQIAANVAMHSPRNVFLTGAAGTGKSWLTRHYLSSRAMEDFPVVASTGAAAILVGGRTFHSFFGLGVSGRSVARMVEAACRRQDVVERMQRVSGILIDEVSMIPGRLLDTAEWIARRARHDKRPWGGLKIIAVGDFRQLPPIARGSEAKDWAFLSEAWGDSEFVPAMLKTPVRTPDPVFFRILNLVRAGVINQEVKDALDSRVCKRVDDFDGTRLFAYKGEVALFNEDRLDELSGEPTCFPTTYKGDPTELEALKKNVPIPEVLRLKIGALVMVRKNYADAGLVNGTLGHVIEIKRDLVFLELLSGSGKVIALGPDAFNVVDDHGKPIATATNFPLSLAWATTIHKSQGCTLDRVLVDVSSLWEPGQAYVALSRVKTLDGLHISRWHPRSIKTDAAVTEFHKRIFG